MSRQHGVYLRSNATSREVWEICHKLTYAHAQIKHKSVCKKRGPFFKPSDQNSLTFLGEGRVFFFSLNETVFYSSAVPQRGEEKHLERIFPFSPLFFPSFSLGSADITMTAIASRCENTTLSFFLFLGLLVLKTEKVLTPKHQCCSMCGDSFRKPSRDALRSSGSDRH